MTPTHTADSKDASDKPIESAPDPQVTKPGSTHANVSGEVAPRLPHEHDESSDSGTRPPDPVMAQAAKDAQGPTQQTDGGEQTEEVYRRNLRGNAGDPD